MARRAKVSRSSRISRPDFQAIRYKPASGGRFSQDRALDIIHKRIDNIAPGQTVWIRAKGGKPGAVKGESGFGRSWWTLGPFDADELSELDEDELLDYLQDLEDPLEIDISNTK